MSQREMFRVTLDAKRRPTLPQVLLDAVGVGAGGDMVAHLEGPGRIVLEAPATVLARLQEAVRAGKDERGADPGAAAITAAQELPGDAAGESAMAPPAGPGAGSAATTEPDAGARR